MQIPAFWKTDLETIETLAQNARVGKVKVLTQSAGGRPVTAFFYGEKQEIVSKANYSSACGARDRSCYAPVEGKKPVVVLLGAVHGGETEGTECALNLISLLETGVDLAGQKQDRLLKAAEGLRLVIVPVCNPDGRARVEPEGIIGLTGDDLRYWMQGTWKDGSLCGWPDCKKVHPIKDEVEFLGGYYNDDGINLMHDNFFRPMARETQAILDLCDAEKPDWVLHLHGGSNSMNALLYTSYVPVEVNEAIQQLAIRCDKVAEKTTEMRFHTGDLPAREHGATPPSFNLTSAVYHVCGGVSAVFESNQCLIDQPGVHYDHAQVYEAHRILFEECFKMAKGE